MLTGGSLVSIVVLNWNGRDVVRDCLRSVLAQTYQNIEIIVVDNNSEDGSLDIARSVVSSAEFIANNRNMGFSYGMNQGIQASSGEFVIPLNMDVQLDRHFVERAIKAIREHDFIGLVAAKVYALLDNQRLAQVVHVGQYLNGRMNLVNSHNLDKTEYVFGPHGCCPFLRRAMLENIRLKPGEYFDNSYFAYYEDLDLWWRAQLAGWRCIFSPEVVAWHTRSSTSGGKTRIVDKPRFLQRIAYRNRYTTILKSLPGDLAWRKLPYLIASDLAFLVYLLLRHPSSFGEFIRGSAESLRRFADTRCKRRLIQRHRQVSLSYLESLFQPGWKAP